NILGLPLVLGLPLFSGLFEITTGAQMISQITTDSVFAKVIIISFILGFNVFSFQAQLSSIIAKIDIHFAPYFFAPLFHRSFVSILIVLLYKTLYLSRQAFEREDIPVVQEVKQNSWISVLDSLQQIGPLITIIFLGVAGWILYRRSFRNINY